MKFFNIFKKKSIRSASTIATIGFTLMIIYIDKKVCSNTGTVYLQLAFKPSDFSSVLTLWGKGGIDYYLKTLWIDFVYALSYGTMLTSVIIYFLEKKYSITPETATGHLKVMLFIPFTATLFDFSENIFHIILLTGSVSTPLVPVSFAVSVLKWTCLTFSLVFFLFLYFGYRKEKR